MMLLQYSGLSSLLQFFSYWYFCCRPVLRPMSHLWFWRATLLRNSTVRYMACGATF